MRREGKGRDVGREEEAGEGKRGGERGWKREERGRGWMLGERGTVR